MNHPSELVLQDVRCFRGEQRGRLRPLTLLVGENSTGKTTFLGCYRVLHRLLSGRWRDEQPDFNEEPFLMGSFRDIVRSRRGPDGRIDKFRLGFTVEHGKVGGKRGYELSVTLSEVGSQPIVSSYRWRFGDGSYLELRQSEAGGLTLEIPNHEVDIDAPFDLSWFRVWITSHRRSRLNREIPAPLVDFLDLKFPGTRKGAGWPFPATHPPVAMAPLRSKPRRTYDPVRETATPEGDHIPMLMMRLDHTAKEQWHSLRDELVAFGRKSGLFSDVKIKRHGKQMSDPFQLQVKVRSGSPANIMDVGYGTSQSLPILVELLAERSNPAMGRTRSAGRTFLLQQPEVHLHPRGQAELASLFINSHKERGDRFLVETHSDYIVDRMRIAVREGALPAAAVSILYFEPTGNAVEIHNMTLDDNGNLQDAPAGYRDFFIKEMDQLLGFRN